MQSTIIFGVNMLNSLAFLRLFNSSLQAAHKLAEISKYKGNILFKWKILETDIDQTCLVYLFHLNPQISYFGCQVMILWRGHPTVYAMRSAWLTVVLHLLTMS